MNQYVNHTASDNMNSDIRAISALQQQADACQIQVDSLQERLEDLEKIVEVLRYKGL